MSTGRRSKRLVNALRIGPETQMPSENSPAIWPAAAGVTRRSVATVSSMPMKASAPLPMTKLPSARHSSVGRGLELGTC